MNRFLTPGLLLCATWLLPACSDSSGPRIGPPSAIVRIMGDDQSGAAGAALSTPLTVRVSDAQGQGVQGVVVTFAVQAGDGTTAPGQAQTDAEGQARTVWTLGREAGSEQRLQASFVRDGGAAAQVQFRATATAGAPVNLVKAEGDNQFGGTNAPLTDSVAVRVTDQFGNGVSGVTVTFNASAGSVSPASRTTNSLGFARTRWTLGPSQGPVVLQASAGSLPPVQFSATAAPLAAISSITPALLVPGGTAVIAGSNFPSDPAAISVLVAGVSTTVTSATATEVRVSLPAAGFGCMPTGNALVQLTAAGATTSRAHPVQVITPRSLGVGEALVSTSADRLDCIDLPTTGSRYMITVTNTDAAVNTSPSAGLQGPTSTLGFRLNSIMAAQAQEPGITATAAPRQAWIAPAGTTPLSADRVAELRTALDRRTAHARHHNDILRASADLIDNMPRAPVRDLSMQAAATQSAAVPAVGDIIPLRVPRVATGASLACTSFDEVHARVAYVGQRSVVLEDTANQVKGSVMDGYFRQLGEDFDARQYGIVRDNFGDPLLLNGQLSGNGRIYMLFTRRVDSSLMSGFVFSGDFYNRTQCPQSNQQEIFYGFAPSDQGTEYTAGSLHRWWSDIRATVIHEVKHVASFAARISRNALAEELWLEEAGAQVAEELWARQVFGYGANANVGYLASVGCELRGLFNVPGQCAGRPTAMIFHFLALYDWMRTPGARSPLGESAPRDASFYGSAWMLLRHAIEHSGRPEQEVLRELNQSTSRGAANMESRIGRPFRDILGDWTMAMALDERPGVPPTGRWHLRSWNLREIYAGMNTELSSPEILAWPLAESPMGYANGSRNVTGLKGGGTSYFELSGSAVPLALQVLGEGGATLPASLRVQIFRIQ
jgi:hypothetical protein